MDVAERPRGVRQVVEVFWVALRLGLTSFGGPIAHLGYFREEYVVRRRWLDEATYADMVALCQFLPGPASSQVGIAVGMTRAGMRGGIAAWLGFTMPSAIALIGFAYGVAQVGNVADAGWLHGLKVVAVAVVAHAVWGMARNLAPDRPRATLAVLAAGVAVVADPGVADRGHPSRRAHRLADADRRWLDCPAIGLPGAALGGNRRDRAVLRAAGGAARARGDPR